MAASTYDQDGFRIRKDDGDEITATWYANLNTNASVPVDIPFRVRLVGELSSGTSGSLQAVAQYSLNGTDWTTITTSSDFVKAVNSPNVTNDEPTTQQLSAPAGYVANSICEDGSSPAALLATSQKTEPEFVLQLVGASLTHEQTVQIRMINVATPLNTYSQVPTITALKTNVARLSGSAFPIIGCGLGIGIK